MSVAKPGSDRAFHEALREVAELPMLERKLLCKAATMYFASCRGREMMRKLGELPESDPRTLIAKRRALHALSLLLRCGMLPGRILEFVLERDPEANRESRKGR